MSNKPLLRLDGASYSYLDRFCALDAVSVEIERAERVALLGANGCGKSTLLKILDGLVFPDSGRYEAFGAEVTESHLEDEQFSRAFRGRIGFVFQNSEAQVFSPTVREEIAFGPLNMGLSADEVTARVDDTLCMLGLAGLGERAPYQLSGGEKKRVAIASVLVMNPEVLLFDEPTAALDPRTQQWLIELMAELHGAGKSVVLATHDLGRLDELADRWSCFPRATRLPLRVRPTRYSLTVICCTPSTSCMMRSVSDADWSPEQYNRFASEREQPFWDLAALVEPVIDARVVDLGCGDGRLTAALNDRLGARHTLGVDNSPAMLAAAAQRADPNIDFADGNIATWEGAGFDIVFSNAALHWVPDHERVLARWRAALRTGGQLAVQMPTNASHASHRAASEVATGLLGADAPPDPVVQNVLPPERYAEVLDELGFVRQHVRLQVYVHHLPRSADVVEWVRGTTLNRFKPVFDSDGYDRFVGEYRRRLLAEIGEQAPYLYTFKRVLLWGRLA